MVVGNQRASSPGRIRVFYIVPLTTLPCCRSDLFSQLARSASFNAHCGRQGESHEQVAALMVAGYGKAAGRPAVCVGTRSPGGTNLVMGVTAAYLDSVPLIAITGQVPTVLQGKGAFEEADLEALFRPVTKGSWQLHRADRIPDLLWEAFRVANSGCPGPVHVSIPYDLAKEEIQTEILPPEAYRPIAPLVPPLTPSTARPAYWRRPNVP